MKTCTFNLFVIVTVLAFAQFSGLFAESYHLVDVVPQKIPIVEKKTIFFSLDLCFDKRPVGYWGFIDPARSAFIIETYGSKIEFPDAEQKAVFKNPGPFKGITVENRTSVFSLTNEKCQIIIGIDPQFQVTDSAIGDSTIRITLGKPLFSNRQPLLSPKVIFSYVGAGTFAAMVVLLFVTFAQN